MVIEINKDIDRYQESVALGLTAKQLIFTAISITVGGGLVFLLYRYIGLTASAYVAIPVVAPIALGGFYSFNGMSFYEVMGKKFYFMFKNRALTYVSTEGEGAIKSRELELEELKRANSKRSKSKFREVDANENREEFEMMKKKMKITIIVSIIGVIAAIIAVVLYKNTH